MFIWHFIHFLAPYYRFCIRFTVRYFISLEFSILFRRNEILPCPLFTRPLLNSLIESNWSQSTKLYVIMLCILNAIYIYFVLYSQITWKKVEFHQIAKSIFCGNGKHAYFILVAGCHFFILISIIFRNISIELFSIVEIWKIISFCLVLFFPHQFNVVRTQYRVSEVNTREWGG